MWELLIRVAIGLSGWVFAGWVMYCRWKSNREMVAGLKEMKQRLDDWPHCPDPPKPPPNCPDPLPPALRTRGPLKPGEPMIIPAGMNYETSARAMKAEPMSLEEVAELCLMNSWKRHVSAPAIVTTAAGFEILAKRLPEAFVRASREAPAGTGWFYDVPLKEYADEGMARVAAIVAEADGYEVMLFLPGDETTDYMDEGDKRLTESKKSAER